ncbi:hypothetical protein VSR01_17510 [Actinacidiphila sp. DG2A-62]|uniref:hypothetical protein n=1 Tax=Actinacidiphila sp. DG2A-62 TaxID=3108821 RepID=UPI002DBB0B56|nr:hypothetical protein [Actinacidiphila sp. DG2A-62]MEC3995237.1 hypothetical protein [Actinacidiphila sp. DG2A-62]
MLSPGLLTHWTREALEAARAGNDSLAAEIAGQITDQADALDLLAACRVIADTAARALRAMYQQPDAERGEAWVLDQLGDAAEHPPRLFAVRLVTAYANHDHDHVTALVAAAGASPAERAESLWSLTTYAAGLDAQAARHHPTKGTDTDEH